MHPEFVVLGAYRGDRESGLRVHGQSVVGCGGALRRGDLFMDPEIALFQAGAGLDVVGRGYELVTDDRREAVVAAYPRGADFERELIDAFYQGMRHRPDSTYGTFNDDVLAFRDPSCQRRNFCEMILGSRWVRSHPWGAEMPRWRP